jgi:pyridoxal phosphate enzyme (YggS family)
MTELPTADEVRRRLAALEERIATKSRHAVSIIAVTKAFPPELLRIAADAGCAAIGENYAQELLAKVPALDGLLTRPEVHFIGRLQSNKVRSLVGVVDVWDSLDRLSVVDEVAKRAPGARVLVQVNATGESGKGGCAVGDVPGLVDRAGGAGLRVDGLMTVGPTEGDPQAARPGFVTVRHLVDELGLRECSMGMTADLDVALEEGTTQIRVGSLLFGDRPP